MRDQSELLGRLPLPLAQILRRALNSKTAVERHNNAFYLAEAALRLAAAARVGVWLDRGLDPKSDVARVLEGLALPGTGHWLVFLKLVDAALTGRTDAALLPLAPTFGRLDERREDWPGVEALADALAAEGVVPAESAGAAKRRGLVGFFEMVVEYRNRVIGHGAQRPTAFYERFQGLLAAAATEVIESEIFLGGLRLAHAGLRGADGRPAPDILWQDLTGLAGVPLDVARRSRLPGGGDSAITPGYVYLVGDGVTIPLHPLLVYAEDEGGREAVGFLNRTSRKTRREGDGEVETIRRADYLDYMTGDNIKGVDTREALTALLGRLRGRRANVADLRAAEDASLASSAERPEELVAAGATIGDFELLEELGRGGMGIVYRARQRSLGRVLALKVLPPLLASDPVTLERFRREIAALGRCDHPNIVKIVTSGVDRERYWYAMELVDGADLARVWRQLSQWRTTHVPLREGHIAAAVSTTGGGPNAAEGPAPAVARAAPEPAPKIEGGREYHIRLAELFSDAALGLEHLHQHGVIHRDVKPGNLMLTADGRRVVVMDLGLAKLVDSSQALTRSDVKVLGTLRYIAPEQLQRNLMQVDHRADVYSLGAALYELASGRPIHDGDTEERLLHQVLTEVPLAPRKAERSVPRDLATIVVKATERDPQRRYQRAGDMAADLKAFAEHRPIAASPPGTWHRSGLFLRRHRLGAASVATAIVTLAAAATAWFLVSGDAPAPATPSPPPERTYYCANKVLRWAVAECVGPVDAARQRRRAATLRFTERGGRVVRVDRVNGSGEPANDEEGNASWDYSYDETGRIQRCVIRDRNGQVRRQWVYSNDLKRAEQHDRFDAPLRHHHAGPFGIELVTGTDASVWLLEYDERGYQIVHRFANVYSSPRPDESGAFGYRFELDGRGLAARGIVLDADGNTGVRRDGMRAWTIIYNPDGDVLERVTLGADGQPAVGAGGYARMTAKYNECGNPIEEAYFDVGGRAVLTIDGYARRTAKYDEHGNQIDQAFFGADGKSVLQKRGYARWTGEFDERGNRVGTSYFGVDGQLVLSTDDIARWTAEYDERGNMIGMAFFGTDRKPALNKDGVARWSRRYDERGSMIESAFFGIDGRPVLNKEGCTRWTAQYDERGNQVEQGYFGIDGQPVLISDGYARWTAEYDERGNQVEQGYFGIDGQPVLNKERYARWTAEFDERGNRVGTSYFGADGTPVLNAYGCGRWTAKYDERGNWVETNCLGSDGRPVLNAYGYAHWAAKYDERGNPVEEAYFGTDGQPVLESNGYARSTARYDDRRNRVETAYLGTDGRPVLARDGYARWTARYDERGNQSELAYFGADGRPILHNDGSARVTKRYDERRNLVDVAYFGTDGRPAVVRDGYARLTARYDARGNCLEQAYFGTDGQPTLTNGRYARWKAKYDQRDHWIETAYFGVDGQPARIKDGYARMTAKYDERGNRIGQAYFGADGRPILNTSGAASDRWEFDERGDLVEVSWFGIDGAPTVTTSGYAREAFERDVWSRVAKSVRYGVDGLPAVGFGGSSSCEYLYDERDNVVEERHFGVDGKPAVYALAYATRRATWDDRGKKVQESYFGTDGAPVPGRQGAPVVRWKYDERGRNVEISYWGTDDKPALSRDRYAVIRKTFDDRGNLVEESYFDGDGRPVRAAAGHAIQRAGYDERNRLVAVQYLDEQGQPISGPEGYASKTLEYDARGNPVGESRRGTDGELLGSVRRRFDERGRVVEEANLAADGSPTVAPDGYSIVRFHYDERGNLVRGDYFGVDGNPAPRDDGSVGFRSVYGLGQALNYTIRFDAGAHAVGGEWTAPRRFEWKLVRGRIVVTDANRQAVEDREERRAFERRVGVYQSGQETENVRAIHPELFAGASGILVVEVVPESAAEVVGIRPGDVLVAYAGNPLSHPEHLTVARDKWTEPEAEVVAIRDGRSITFRVMRGLLGVKTEPQR